MTAQMIQSDPKTDPPSLNQLLIGGVGEHAASPGLDGPTSELLSTNRNLERCLRLLSLPEKSWGALRGVYQILKAELRPRNWQELASLDTTTEELNRFRRSLSARRGKISALSAWLGAKLQGRPPMTITEAHDLARRMVAAWISRMVSQRPDASSAPALAGTDRDRIGIGRDVVEAQRRPGDRPVTIALGTIFILVMMAWCSVLAYGAWSALRWMTTP
jgi:hypothetical protein